MPLGRIIQFLYFPNLFFRKTALCNHLIFHLFFQQFPRFLFHFFFGQNCDLIYRFPCSCVHFHLCFSGLYSLHKKGFIRLICQGRYFVGSIQILLVYLCFFLVIYRCLCLIHIGCQHFLAAFYHGYFLLRFCHILSAKYSHNTRNHKNSCRPNFSHILSLHLLYYIII